MHHLMVAFHSWKNRASGVDNMHAENHNMSHHVQRFNVRYVSEGGFCGKPNADGTRQMLLQGAPS